LYRRHRVPIQCKRCWAKFKSQSELEEHYDVDDICEKKPGRTSEGVTNDIEKQLCSRKKLGPGQSEEDRWKEIYKLLFPDEITPSPCEYIIFFAFWFKLHLIKLHMAKRTWRDLLLTNEQDFDPVYENSRQSPDTKELEDYEEYSRRELPRLYKSALEFAINHQPANATARRTTEKPTRCYDTGLSRQGVFGLQSFQASTQQREFNRSHARKRR
jgi:hypothetical protein